MQYYMNMLYIYISAMAANQVLNLRDRIFFKLQTRTCVKNLPKRHNSKSQMQKILRMCKVEVFKLILLEPYPIFVKNLCIFINHLI